MQAGHGAVASDVGVEWLKAKGSWIFYGGFVLVARYLVGATFRLPTYQSWTLVNVFHSVITFFLFHWVKGSPFPTHWTYSPYNVDNYTWWEQIDSRWQNTPSRKFCTALVIVLYLFTFESTPLAYKGYHLINFTAFAVAFIAKLPQMDKVRIFGINK